jgi:hypothetical protein
MQYDIKLCPHPQEPPGGIDPTSRGDRPPRKLQFHALFVQFIKVFRFFDFTNRQLMFEKRASGKTDGQTIF